MKKLLAILLLLPVLALADPPTTSYPVLHFDPATGHFVPTTTNGHPIGTAGVVVSTAGTVADGDFVVFDGTGGQTIRKATSFEIFDYGNDDGIGFIPWWNTAPVTHLWDKLLFSDNESMGTSATTISSQRAVKSYVDGKFNTATFSGVTTFNDGTNGTFLRLVADTGDLVRNTITSGPIVSPASEGGIYFAIGGTPTFMIDSGDSNLLLIRNTDDKITINAQDGDIELTPSTNIVKLSTNTALTFLGTGAATTRTNLGLGTAAVANTGTGAGAVPTGGVITAGGPTGSSSAVPVITYNAAGQLTAVTTASISSGLTIGTTSITSGTGSTKVLFDNSGTLGETATPTLTGTNFTGIPESGVTNLTTDLAGKQATLTLGTGVLTALAVNVGSAGAFVTFNGAGGTPSSLTGTNISGTAASLTAGNVTTNANLTGPVTSVGNATTIASDAVTTVKILDANVTLAKMANVATDSILGRATAASGVPEVLTALPFAFTGDVTRAADSNATVLANIPAIAGTNLTGTAANLTAGNVTTNANLTGHITSVGNAAVLGSFTKAQLNTAVSDDDPAYVGTANTFTAAQTNSTAGAASLPSAKWTGVPFAGTGTTSFPLVYINDSNATASTVLATAGTYFGVNGHSTQDLMNLLKDGASMMSVTSGGVITANNNITSTNGSCQVGAAGFRWTSNGTRLIEYGDGKLRIRDSSDLGTVAHFLSFGLSTNSSPAIANDTVNSISIQSAAGTVTFNDPSTANSGTVANRYLFGIAAPTLTATGTSVTDTVASTVYIGGAPTASTNTTIGTAYALNVAAGATNLGGSLKIGGGTAMLKVLSATATLDFSSTAAGSSADLTITVTGAALGDAVVLGVPNGSIVANSSYSGWVSATDTVTVRFVDNALVGTADPASGTFRAQVNQF